MDKNFGESFRILRTMKKYKLKEIATDEVSASQISKFERGEANMSIDKVFIALDNMNVTFDEFETTYHNVTRTLNFVHRLDYDKYYNLKDIAKLKEFLSELGQKIIDEPYKIRRKLNKIVIENMLEEISDFKLSPVQKKKNQQRLETYFSEIEIFNEYEIWVLSETYMMLSEEIRYRIIQFSFGNTQFVSGNAKRRHTMIKFYANLLHESLKKDDTVRALEYIQFLEDMGIVSNGTTEYDLWDRSMFHFYSGMYKVKIGNESGYADMENIINYLGILNSKALQTKFEREYEQLKMD